MTDREPGFYWVRYGGEWEPAQKIEGNIYCKYFWQLLGAEDIYQTEELD